MRTSLSLLSLELWWLALYQESYSTPLGFALLVANPTCVIPGIRAAPCRRLKKFESCDGLAVLVLAFETTNLSVQPPSVGRTLPCAAPNMEYVPTLSSRMSTSVPIST